MAAQSIVSRDVLARYAADAAREVEGVSALSEHALHREKGVGVKGTDGEPGIEVNIELEWGRSTADVAAEVQRRVAEYLERMAGVKPQAVDVVVVGVGPPPARR